MTIERLTSTARGRGWTTRPYSPDPGFRTDWWQQTLAGPPRDWFTFLDSQRFELVRAEIKPHSDAARGYEGVKVPSAGFAEVAYFEVHSEHQREGFGTDAIDLLTDFYQDRQLAAFSEGADHFWGSLGWTPHRPLLGPDDYEGHYQTFFVSR